MNTDNRTFISETSRIQVAYVAELIRAGMEAPETKADFAEGELILPLLLEPVYFGLQMTSDILTNDPRPDRPRSLALTRLCHLAAFAMAINVAAMPETNEPTA